MLAYYVAPISMKVWTARHRCVSSATKSDTKLVSVSQRTSSSALVVDRWDICKLAASRYGTILQ